MRVLISGGGTGGHIFPALAVAQALAEIQPAADILYVGRRGGMEEQIVAGAGYRAEMIGIRGIQDEWYRNVPLLYSLPAAIARASGLIRRFQPQVVFGSGGYVVGAVGAAALLHRRPLVLQVPDAVPGRAIRRLSGRAFAVCSAFGETAQHLPGARVVLTGNPLRPEFVRRARELRAAPPRDVDRLRRLVVFGGSQGANRLNTAVAEALKDLLELPDLTVHHICGDLDFDQLHAMRIGLPSELGARYTVERFTAVMDQVLSGADLVLARAGGSIAELTALGLPMILVPYPYAGGHQRSNAEPLVAAGAAVLVPDAELSGIRLLREVNRLAGDPQLLTAMARNSLGLGRPDAAHDVARLVVEAAKVADAAA